MVSLSPSTIEPLVARFLNNGMLLYQPITTSNYPAVLPGAAPPILDSRGRRPVTVKP